MPTTIARAQFCVFAAPLHFMTLKTIFYITLHKSSTATRPQRLTRWTLVLSTFSLKTIWQNYELPVATGRAPVLQIIIQAGTSIPLNRWWQSTSFLHQLTGEDCHCQTLTMQTTKSTPNS